MGTYDLVILGGGPTGLAAGLYGTRSRLKTLVLERGTIGGQLAVTEDVENYPGIEAIKGPELGQKMLEHAEKFGLEMEYVEVESVDLESEIKVVRTDDKEYHAKALVIATGSTHNKLEIPGEDEFSGRGVSYCAVCDGAFFRDRDLIVALWKCHKIGDQDPSRGIIPYGSYLGIFELFEQTAEKDLIRSVFIQEMLARGVLLTASHNVCYAHDDENFATTLDAYDGALAKISDGIYRGHRTG